jgi:hypothetical protein
MLRLAWIVVKISTAFVAVVAFVIGTFLSYELWSAQRKIDAANATAILEGEQVINLNTRFAAVDICVLPAEAFVAEWVNRTKPGYRPKEVIDPDSSLYWAILAFDLNEKTYRYFLMNRQVVALEGERSYCSGNLTVKTEKNNDPKLDSKWIATVMQ